MEKIKVYQPARMDLILKSQVTKLVEIEAFKEIELGEKEYRNQLQEVIDAYGWRQDFAEIGLTGVAVIDNRLKSSFLAKVGGVGCLVEPNCPNFEGVITPEGIFVIQYQLGDKYRNKKPIDVSSNLHRLEQGLTVKERLGIHLFEGNVAVWKCFTDCIGSVSPGGNVPYLRWYGGPCLYAYSGGNAFPDYGSGSRGSV